MIAFTLMNSAQRRTLEAIFASPTPSNLAWRQIEGLFVALGAQMIEGHGSRVRFELNDKLPLFIDHTLTKKRNPIKCVMHVSF